MKRVAAFILSLVLIVLAVGFSGCSAATAETGAAEDSAVYNQWYDFVTAHPSRTTGTKGEADAAVYIKEKFEQFGYSAEAEEFFADTQGYVSGVSGSFASKNVIAKKEFAGNTKQVVVGAHYDNAVQMNASQSGIVGGQGAFDNGSGVAVLLALAEKFSVYPSLPFNIVFVAFGAEELGLLGAENFVSKMTQEQKDATLLMVNADVVGFGDYNYIYGEDISNPQENFFTSVSRKLNLSNPVEKMPKTSIVGISADGSRPYYNTGHASDSFAFVKAGIPAAFFFSGNFDSGYFGYQETVNGTDITNIMHTTDDTTAFIINNFREQFSCNLNTVTETIFGGLTDEGFVDAVKNARNRIVNPFWLNQYYAYAFLLAAAVAVALLGFKYYHSLQKKALVGIAEAKPKRIVDKPPAEDIFGDF